MNVYIIEGDSARIHEIGFVICGVYKYVYIYIYMYTIYIYIYVCL